VWAGDAAMLFRIESVRVEALALVDTLHTTLQPRSASYLGFRIAVKDLRPDPHSNDDPGARDYQASLLVTNTDG
jgi:hypothetical protein